MKTIHWVGVAALLGWSTLQTLAIGGLQISAQNTNLVLSWPSQGYEQYLVQYRHTLDPSDSWSTVTNAYPANSTNRTTFTIYGVVPLPPGNGGMQAATMNLAQQTFLTVPMVLSANGSGGAVPLALYPPGCDLSGFLVYDPVTDELLNWADYVATPANLSRLESENPVPMDGGGTDSPTLEPETGFYQVFHIPNFPASITNYVFDGPTFIPVDFGDYQERVESVAVLLDGQMIADAVLTSLFYNGQTNWGMGIYFDLFPSGTHQIQLVSTLRLNDEMGDGSVYLTLSNLTRTITIDNLVSFTNWDGLVMSSNFIYTAQSKNPDTDWYIDLYDANGYYVNGGSGHTYDGQISWTWDLTDYNGNPRDDLDYDPFFYAEITVETASSSGFGPQGATTTRSAPAPQMEYPNTGYWVVSYLDRHYLEAGPNYPNVQEKLVGAMSAIEGGVEYRGIPCDQLPLKFGTNIYSQQERNDSWAYLKARLFDPRTRNFYYFGHGGANYIGCDIHTFDTNNDISGGINLQNSKAYLWSQTVSNELTYNHHGGARPYRFVWLDGCSTANGNWPGAFGVDKAVYDLDHYTNSVTNPKHRRPSAFVGWNQTVGGAGWGSATTFFYFRSEWMAKWYYNWQTEGLLQSFKDASQSASWPPGGETQLLGAMKVYGYNNLLMNGYNHKNDWRWP